MNSSRLINIDLVKFFAIVLMIIDHIILVTWQGPLTLSVYILFSLAPLSQAAFLFSSGYLMGRFWNKAKVKKYLIRVLVFIGIYLASNFLVGEAFASSGNILFNFAMSTAISLCFLYFDRIKWLLYFSGLLFVINFTWYLFDNLDLIVFDKIFANYSYPINSYSIYFFVGVLFFYYSDRIQLWFKNFWMSILVGFLLLTYPIIFFLGIKINIYDMYLHLPLLLAVDLIICIYFIYRWQVINLNKVIASIVVAVSNALFYIYIIHYIVLFTIARSIGWNWWQASMVVFFIILLSIGLKDFLPKIIKKEAH